MVDQTDFFAALQQCSTGERASLRRNCGKLLKDADGQAVVIFYRYVPRSIPAWQEDYWFAALLLEDLLYWNSSTQSVQRKWAKAMYE